jgi:hypothetical protein
MGRASYYERRRKKKAATFRTACLQTAVRMIAVAMQLDLRGFLAIVTAVLGAVRHLACATGMGASMLDGLGICHGRLL